MYLSREKVDSIMFGRNVVVSDPTNKEPLTIEIKPGIYNCYKRKYYDQTNPKESLAIADIYLWHPDYEIVNPDELLTKVIVSSSIVGFFVKSYFDELDKEHINEKFKDQVHTTLPNLFYKKFEDSPYKYPLKDNMTDEEMREYLTSRRLYLQDKDISVENFIVPTVSKVDNKAIVTTCDEDIEVYLLGGRTDNGKLVALRLAIIPTIREMRQWDAEMESKLENLDLDDME